jgi:hypothetical protein
LLTRIYFETGILEVRGQKHERSRRRLSFFSLPSFGSCLYLKSNAQKKTDGTDYAGNERTIGVSDPQKIRGDQCCDRRGYLKNSFHPI